MSLEYDEPGEYRIRPGSRDRLDFLAEHPGWDVRYVPAYGYFEVTGPDGILTGYDLPALLSRARQVTGRKGTVKGRYEIGRRYAARTAARLLRYRQPYEDKPDS